MQQLGPRAGLAGTSGKREYSRGSGTRLGKSDDDDAYARLRGSEFDAEPPG
jgi:hypothetical protein